ncbi:hypothetical protein [Corynebacterium glucuronolyticum]|uniref:TIGR02391 family protein n=2 Tax=Corynebacterium glucuronolyticum TaxID=39791 RepID=A0AAX1L8A6_9CORY|nr:hypothetical protein [Corynebacterium glucuronolyticum]EEI63875.1 hypothetical protein HMPREF0293_0671 [Corynebacterium glucuronolyticum ATCC 51866]QRP70652.1 hypothetical protein I6J21_00235 [Corynebacterium glucuronolyticum]
MLQDDFFETIEYSPTGMGTWEGTKQRLRIDLVQAAWHSTLPQSDLEVVRPLMMLVRREYTAHGTNEYYLLSNEELALCRRALQAVCKRLGYQLNIPFTGGDSFREYWKRQGASYNFQARREIISNIFDPLELHIEKLEDTAVENTLATPVSPRGQTGWQQVDHEIRELRVKFAGARTSADYSDVGNRAVRVLESLNRVAFDPARHIPKGVDASNFTEGKTKNRLERFVEVELPGKSNQELRSLVRNVVSLANNVKHAQTPTRREAGIAADSVIMLSNLLRRLIEAE